MLKTVSRAAVAAALAVTIAAPAVAKERLSISTWGSPKHYQVAEFIPQFEKLLKDKSKGEISMKIFAGGEMVKQQFVPTAIPQGTVDISLTLLDNWSGTIPEVSILTSPLWTRSMEWSRDNLKPGKPIFDYFDAKLRSQGAVVIAMFDIGPPVISANFEVTGPDSLANMPIRVYSKGSGEVIQALGGAPTVMGVGDVYSGLQRGTVKGALGGLGGAVGLKHYEVTSNMFVPNGVMGTLIHAYVMNKDRFEKLSPALRKAVMDSALEARNHMQQFAIDKQTALLDQVRKAGKKVTVVERDGALWKGFEKKLEPLTAEARSKYPADLVKMVTSN